MEIATLELIHAMLKKEKNFAESNLKMKEKAYKEADDFHNFLVETGDTPSVIVEAKAYAVRKKEEFVRASDILMQIDLALDDFERQDFQVQLTMKKEA